MILRNYLSPYRSGTFIYTKITKDTEFVFILEIKDRNNTDYLYEDETETTEILGG